MRLHDGEANRILQLIPVGEYTRLAPHLMTVHLRQRERLTGASEPISYVCFPQSGVLSAIARFRDGRAMEVGTVGNEGMFGLPVFLAHDRIPLETMAIVPGSAKRVSAEVFRDLLSEMAVLDVILRRYTLVYLAQVAQSAACNRRHSIRERCARWLLTTHDRMAVDDFHVTQDLLALTLGSGRAGVSLAAGLLQDERLIQYARGRVSIIDREGLEAAACECYRVVRRHLDAVLPPD